MAAQSTLAGTAGAGAGGEKFGKKGSKVSLQVGELAEAWEGDRQIRNRLRSNDGKLLMWAQQAVINKGSMANIALNSNALTHLAAWWCKRQKTPKSPSVQDLKREAIH